MQDINQTTTSAEEVSESDILSLNDELVVETNQSTTTRASNGIIESVSLLSYEWVEVSELDNLLNDELE